MLASMGCSATGLSAAVVTAQPGGTPSFSRCHWAMHRAAASLASFREVNGKPAACASAANVDAEGLEPGVASNGSTGSLGAGRALEVGSSVAFGYGCTFQRKIGGLWTRIGVPALLQSVQNGLPVFLF